MVRYIVSGYIGFDNFGDEAIAKVLTENLKKQGAKSITLISSNPQKTASLYNVSSCSMFNFIPAIMKSDVLISGGGSLLQDVTSIKSLLYYLSVIYTALFFGKKVEIFAQGIGPIHSKLGQILTKIALKNAYKISVRDNASKELLKSWGIESKLVEDPVFSIDFPSKNAVGTVGIQLRKWNGINQMFLEHLANKIVEKFPEKKIEILSLQDNMDLETCRQFAAILENKGIKPDIFSNLTVNEVFEKISDMEYLISMRFHAGVAAIKSGVKTLLINYDPKVKNLSEKYNLPLIEIGQEDLSKEFEALLTK